MFIMQGEEVKLIRHIVSYTENEIEMQEMCVSDEHKNEMEQILTDRVVEFTSKAVNQSQNEWFNGLRFNSYDEAIKVFEAGERAYADRQTKDPITQLQLALAELAEIVLGG